MGDTFKPPGEGQVISRILDEFASAYWEQWLTGDIEPRVHFKSTDSVLQVAVTLVMLNTELHVAPKKVKKAKEPMDLNGYVSLVRRCVAEDEVPREALGFWYDNVKLEEISMEPMPRTPFSKLPVQPEIEGWLLLILGPRPGQREIYRYWGVLALQRLYLFSDKSDIEQFDAVDLKNATVARVAEDVAARKRYAQDLQPRFSGRPCCPCNMLCQRAQPLDIQHYLEADTRAFEIRLPTTSSRFHAKFQDLLDELPFAKRHRLALVAETDELCAKWVGLISSGPY